MLHILTNRNIINITYIAISGVHFKIQRDIMESNTKIKTKPLSFYLKNRNTEFYTRGTVDSIKIICEIIYTETEIYTLSENVII